MRFLWKYVWHAFSFVKLHWKLMIKVLKSNSIFSFHYYFEQFALLSVSCSIQEAIRLHFSSKHFDIIQEEGQYTHRILWRISTWGIILLTSKNVLLWRIFLHVFPFCLFWIKGYSTVTSFVLHLSHLLHIFQKFLTILVYWRCSLMFQWC